MSGNLRRRNREKTLQEKEEALRKLHHMERIKAKNTMLQAEFEKHKKILLVNASDSSKNSEARLRFQLNELQSINIKKLEDLRRLALVREAKKSLFAANGTVAGVKTSRAGPKMSKDDMFLSLDCQTDRIAGVTVNQRDSTEVLAEKIAKLTEAYENIEKLSKVEEEAGAAMMDKYEELASDHRLLSKRVNEMRKANEHFSRRFSHLEQIEFTAQAKYSDTLKNLTELREITKDLRQKEDNFRNEKYKMKEHEENSMIEHQNRMSNMMVSLDDKVIENMRVIEELKKEELKYEDWIEKRKCTKLSAEYAIILEDLHNFFFNPDAPKDALLRIIESKEEEKRITFVEEQGDRSAKSSRRPSLMSAGTPSLKPRGSFLDRNYCIEKIQNFYEKYPGGPNQLVIPLMNLYSEFCFKESSLKRIFEDMESEKLKKEYQLSTLQNEIAKLKAPTDEDATDGGIFEINSQKTTMNQAKFLYDSQKHADSDLRYIEEYETFLVRCYLDSIEMMIR